MGQISRLALHVVGLLFFLDGLIVFLKGLLYRALEAALWVTVINL